MLPARRRGQLRTQLVFVTTTDDHFGRPASTTTVIDGQHFVRHIAYDDLGRPKHAVYPQAISKSEK
jgi:hypothetical protein